MSTVISFLERMGSDSSLRRADQTAMASALAESSVDAGLWSAIIAGDTRTLEKEVGATPNVCAVIFPVESDERTDTYTDR